MEFGSDTRSVTEHAESAASGGSGQTIFALSTAPGRAGIAVLRLSGPSAGAALRSLTGQALPPPRKAVLRRFRDPSGGETIDSGLALWLPGPASFSGEDMAELQIHGGRAVPAAMIEALGRLPGLRPAEPGEFSRRAFEHGKLDLTAVEAIADLVNAETAAQRRQALRQLSGALGHLYEAWRGRLLRVQATLEATIDFPEDVPDSTIRSIAHELLGLGSEISQHLDDGRRGERLREGFSVAVVGAPNVGKSSLLNWLVRREAAIVSATAGTTRDVIEVHLDLAGYPLILADTAGLRESSDEIEAEGVRRALARAAAADLCLVVLDATRWPEIDAAVAAEISNGAVVVLNKIDLAPQPERVALGEISVLPVSVKSGAGLDRLLELLTDKVAEGMAVESLPALTRERHRQALVECRDCLQRAILAASAGGTPELAAEDVRLAARALGRVTGKVDVEDMLDVLFREFCIGK